MALQNQQSTHSFSSQIHIIIILFSNLYFLLFLLPCPIHSLPSAKYPCVYFTYVFPSYWKSHVIFQWQIAQAYIYFFLFMTAVLCRITYLQITENKRMHGKYFYASEWLSFFFLSIFNFYSH